MSASADLNLREVSSTGNLRLLPRPVAARAQEAGAPARQSQVFLWEAKLTGPAGEGSQALRFTFVSPQAETLLGYPRDRWLSEPDFWLNRVHPDDRERVRDLLWRSALGKRVYDDFECRTVAANGETLWLRVKLHRLSPGGSGSARLSGLMFDITDRVRREEMCPHSGNLQCFRSDELHVRHRITRAILTTHDLDSVLNTILDEILSLLNIEVGGIYLSTEEGLGLSVCRGVPGPVQEAMAFFGHDARPEWMHDLEPAPNAGGLDRGPVPEPAASQGIRSWVWMPLKEPAQSHQRDTCSETGSCPPPLLGGLFLASPRDYAFSRDRLRALLALNEQIGLAIDRARLVQRMREEARVTGVLLRLETALNRARGPQQVCETAVQHIPRLFEGTETYVWRWDRQGARPVPASAPAGLPDGVRKAFFEPESPVGESRAFAHVLRTRLPLHVKDVPRDPLTPETLWSALNAGSLLLTPLVTGDEVLGLVGFIRAAPGAMSGRDVELARGAAQAVATALQGEEAREELEQQRRHLREACDELQKTQQAMMIQERLRALGEMASGIAHDVGNALSPIVGYSDLLLCEENNLSERARKFLEIIKRAGSDINHTVARMKEFYRRRDEREELRPVRLNDAAEQVIDLTRPRWRDMCQRKGIMVHVRTDFQDDLPAVMASESEVREAVTNLVFNSVDAMPQGGSMTLRTRSASEEVVLTVADEGVGMDEETRRRCLEPFFSTKGQEGTGLGLSIVAAIMQRHGGDVRIRSEPGKGTTVDLVFRPYGAEARAAEPPRPPSARGIPPSRILCIDDDALVRDLVTEMLKGDGHTVEAAENGQVGLNTFRAAARLGEPFDAVLVDFGMPYLDGREVAQLIKRESPRTPVVMLTAWAKELKAQGRVPDRVDAILEKPPKIEDLRAALSQVLMPRR